MERPGAILSGFNGWHPDPWTQAQQAGDRNNNSLYTSGLITGGESALEDSVHSVKVVRMVKVGPGKWEQYYEDRDVPSQEAGRLSPTSRDKTDELQ